jgi:hypothetical protein
MKERNNTFISATLCIVQQLVSGLLWSLIIVARMLSRQGMDTANEQNYCWRSYFACKVVANVTMIRVIHRTSLSGVLCWWDTLKVAPSQLASVLPGLCEAPTLLVSQKKNV